MQEAAESATDKARDASRRMKQRAQVSCFARRRNVVSQRAGLVLNLADSTVPELANELPPF